ncbi:MAG TPA: hypothetical protein PLB27_14700 [Bacteroidales bacterium]|nr:hypothetical protein [Bacteroidales bacterium]
MNSGEITFQFTFIPENPEVTDLDGLPGYDVLNDPAGDEFRELCRDLVWYHFTETWETMKSFLENERIESIGFCIDLTKAPCRLASVRISGSRSLRSVEKKPVYYISRTLLEEYLRNYFKKGYNISPCESTAMHHEFVHTLDRFQEELFALNEGRSRGKSVLLHLLRFRSEGIANLLHTLVSDTGIRNMDSARKMFETELYRVFEISWKHPKDFESLSLNLPETGTFYDIGPWMVLHVLSCPGNPKRCEKINLVLENLKRGIRTRDNIIYSLIREALEITNFTFLKYLTEPGLDGHPFIDKKDMSLLVNVTGQIGMKTPKDRSFDDRDSQIAGYYVNKTIKMYNHWGKVDKPRKK